MTNLDMTPQAVIERNETVAVWLKEDNLDLDEATGLLELSAQDAIAMAERVRTFHEQLYGLDFDTFHPLVTLMHQISEFCYCATWMDDLEYSLWHAVLSNEDIKYGQEVITQEQSQKLSELADRHRCWFVWNDNLSFPTPVSLDWWIKHYKEVSTNAPS